MQFNRNMHVCITIEEIVEFECQVLFVDAKYNYQASQPGEEQCDILVSI